MAQEGIEGVSLERARVFYFVGVSVHNWLNRTVGTPVLGSRTLAGWLQEYPLWDGASCASLLWCSTSQ